VKSLKRLLYRANDFDINNRYEMLIQAAADGHRAGPHSPAVESQQNNNLQET